MPATFAAVTVNEYEVPLVRPVTAHVVAPPVLQVAPPGLAVAVYPVMALPPLEAGADHASDTWPLLGVAEFRVGAPGTVRGVAESELDGGPPPAAFVAVTVKEYDVPFVRPPIVQPSPEFEQVAPPGLAVAV